MSLTAVLRDGSKLSEHTVAETMAALKRLHSKEYGHFITLVEHCKRHSNDYPLSDPYRRRGEVSFPDCLWRHCLLDGDRKVSQAVRTILLNSVEDRGGSLRLTNPVIRKIDDGDDARASACAIVAFVAILLVGLGAEYVKRAIG